MDHFPGTLGPDTVKIVADAVVEATDNLTLLPGTVMLFCGPSGLDIQGILTAQGTAVDSIEFTTLTATNPGRWRGLTLSGNAGASVCDFVKISEARALTTDRVHGGALNLNQVSPQFSRSTIKGAGALRGGAVYCVGGSPIFSDCVFRECSADSGGIFDVQSGTNLTLSGCDFSSGSATAGGAVLAFGASGIIENCRFHENSAAAAGGAIHLDSSPLILRNNLIYGNSAGSAGGGLFISGITTTAEFNTLAGNSAVDGAGMYMRFGSSQIKNNIISANHGDGIFFFVAPTSVVKFNCVAQNDSGNFVFFANSPAQAPVGVGALDSLNANGDPCDRYRNIQIDPQFVSGTGYDFYLEQMAAGGIEDSPSVNAADTLATVPVGTTRVDFLADAGVADQGYHGPQLGGPPAAIDDLTLKATADSLRLTWSYDGMGLFTVKTDSLQDGNFMTILAVTTDTTVTVPLALPLHPTKGFFHVTVEHLP
ncbi:MAG: right-handed parallel beta-helix repeat-containing protein [bacterium]|nr:right-handed parallel beta-helix repeat-containing protein [bacterium]